MQNSLVAPDLIILALNIAIATIALSVIGLLIGKSRRFTGMPVQHNLLCVLVILIFLSPASIWLSYRSGLGRNRSHPGVAGM